MTSARARPVALHRRASSEIAARYDVILCDVWGVLHNGLAAFAPACEALTRFRERGGTVVLVTNAPRPGERRRRPARPARRPARRLRRHRHLRRPDPRRSSSEREHAGRASHRAAARPADLRRPRRCASADSTSADYVVCSGLSTTTTRDRRGLPAARSRAMRDARPSDGLRQSRPRGRARRPAHPLRRRDRACLRGDRRRRCSMPASRTGRSTRRR